MMADATAKDLLGTRIEVIPEDIRVFATIFAARFPRVESAVHLGDNAAG